MRLQLGAALLSLLAMTSVTRADEVIRIALIDPLSGPFAGSGQLGERHFRLAIDRVNATHAAGPGRSFELVPMDNQISPTVSLSMLRQAVNQGIRYVTQGDGSSVGYALIGGVDKNNKRNPLRSVLYLNYAADDPGMTNAGCSWYHFRFDADADMKMKALADYLVGQTSIHKVYLFNQDYSFGIAVQNAAQKMLAGRRPDLQIVGSERIPLGTIKDFTPYVARIQASGADAVITADWGQDLILLVKAAADSGYKGRFFTYFLGDQATVAAAGPSAVGDAQVSVWANNVPGGDEIAAAFQKRYSYSFFYWQIVNEIDMLAAAIKQANSTDPIVVGKVLSTLSRPSVLGSSIMRSDNHQLLQPLFVTELEPGLPNVYPDTHLGWKPVDTEQAEATRLSTTCHFSDAP